MVRLLLTNIILFFVFGTPVWGDVMGKFEPETFESVEIESLEDNECSPTFAAFSLEDQGIKINAPTKVRVRFNDDEFDPDSVIPLCLALQFSSKFFSQFEYLFSAITLVMVNKQTGKSFSGTLTPSEPMDFIPSYEIPDDILTQSVERQYINVNILEYLTLPGHSATYFTYAIIDEFKSNTIETELISEE